MLFFDTGYHKFFPLSSCDHEKDNVTKSFNTMSPDHSEISLTIPKMTSHLLND